MPSSTNLEIAQDLSVSSRARLGFQLGQLLSQCVSALRRSLSTTSAARWRRESARSPSLPSQPFQLGVEPWRGFFASRSRSASTSITSGHGAPGCAGRRAARSPTVAALCIRRPATAMLSSRPIFDQVAAVALDPPAALSSSASMQQHRQRPARVRYPFRRGSGAGRV